MLRLAIALGRVFPAWSPRSAQVLGGSPRCRSPCPPASRPGRCCECQRELASWIRSRTQVRGRQEAARYGQSYMDRVVARLLLPDAAHHGLVLSIALLSCVDFDAPRPPATRRATPLRDIAQQGPDIPASDKAMGSVDRRAISKLPLHCSGLPLTPAPRSWRVRPAADHPTDRRSWWHRASCPPAPRRRA